MFSVFRRPGRAGQGPQRRIAADATVPGLLESREKGESVASHELGAMPPMYGPMRHFLIATLLSSLALTGCVAATQPQHDEANLPAMRWDHRPEAAEWTISSMNVVALHDERLAEQVPADIEGWCPGYKTASLDERRAFWVGLLSATAKHESTWNPKASGGGGKWIGLMQIDPRTARNYGCQATSSADLKNGSANLACAIRIMSTQVAKDGMVAGGGNRGIGRDWAPFRSAAKRADMAAWTKSQSYCQG